jgi:hypothetical protein
MRKVLIPIFVFLLSFSFTASNAQNAKAPAKKESVKTKKDGTPDMRYKENKDDVKPAPKHLKKDGTPDKRYKENKK